MEQMKAEFYLLILLSMPTFAQRATGVDYNLSADYKKYTNLKKAGVAGIVVSEPHGWPAMW